MGIRVGLIRVIYRREWRGERGGWHLVEEKGWQERFSNRGGEQGESKAVGMLMSCSCIYCLHSVFF